MRDRVLVEARAKGLSEQDIDAALRHPFRQLLKPDIIISAVAVSVMLLIYYTAVGFSVIYLTTVFGFSVKDGNGLGNWNWGFNVIAVILIGIISDRFRVRKPFMVIGGVLAAVMTVVYLVQAGHHPGYYTLAIMLALLAFGLGVAYTPWMASFTETVEARNPALTATGLAIWGWIVRVTVFVAYLIIPAVITSVTPLVTYGPTVQAYATQYCSELAFARRTRTWWRPPRRSPRRSSPPPSRSRRRSWRPPRRSPRPSWPPPRRTARSWRTRRSSARTGGDPGQPGAVRQAGHLQEPGHDPARAHRPGGQRRRGRGQGPQDPGDDRGQPGGHRRGDRGGGPALQTVAPYAADLTTIAPYSTQLTTIAPYSAELTTMAPYGAQLTALSKVPRRPSPT